MTVDDTAPTAPTLALSSGTSGTWQDTASVTVSASGSTDGGSGLAGYEFRIGGGSWTAGTTSSTITAEGSTTVEFRALDNVGNTSTVATATVRRSDRLRGLLHDRAWGADTPCDEPVCSICSRAARDILAGLAPAAPEDRP